MPLSNQVLFSEFEKFMNAESASFNNFPVSPVEFGQLFSSAVDKYVSTIFPAVTPAARSQGKIALSSALAAVGPPPKGLPFTETISAAMAAYSITIAGGMLPAFVGVPPVQPIGNLIQPVFALGMASRPSAEILSAMSKIIHSWFKTGTATPSGGGSPIPWS
jgi:hypothetical protein